MIEITKSISFNEKEVKYDAIRASGPGGQHVNKTSTAIQLRFDVVGSPSLPEWLKHRVIKIAGSLSTKSGSIIIKSKIHRSQNQNKKEAFKRLIHIINEAANKPKQRKKTTPTKSSIESRIHSKRKRSEKKKLRKIPIIDD